MLSEIVVFYSDFESPLGTMIGGATENGVCFLEWHDRGGVERIKEKVIKRYACRLKEGSSDHLEMLRDQLFSYFEGELNSFSVPIDVTGTVFEQRVWQELLKIPYGETRSYGQLAKKLNKPGASRAVGRANGANYLSIMLPCHRVIEAGGRLCGYGGKLWRKRRLLELEGAITEGKQESLPI